MIKIQEIPVEHINDFWEIHIRYLIDDEIIVDKEDIDYFSGNEYRNTLKTLMNREPDKLHIIYFIRDGLKIGASSYCIYKSENGKCFILDYWIFPKFRGNQTGHQCFEALENYTKKDGAKHFELNCTKENSIRFWKSIGFIENGIDEYEMPLFRKD